MATINAVIRKGRTRADGETKVNIAIRHHQQTAYIPLDITCKEENFVNGHIIGDKKAASKNAEILVYIKSLKNLLKDIENVEALSVTQLKDRLVDSGSSRKIVSFHELLDLVIDKSNESTKTKLKNAARFVDEFNKGKDVTLASMDNVYMTKLCEWMKTAKTVHDKTLKPQTMKNYLMNLRCLINYGIKKGMVSYKYNPFCDVKLPPGVVKEINISIDDFIKFRNYDPESKAEKTVKDLFFLSFYLGGINMADLFKLNFLGDKIVYKRQKTEERTNGMYTIKIPIVKQAREILDEYTNDEGYMNLDFMYVKKRNYDDKKQETKAAVHTFAAKSSRVYKEIARKIGIPKFTYYDSRKMFAQIGLNLGISDSVIDYILGHSPSKRGIINSYSQVNEELASVAIDMIVEFSFKPEDIKDIFKKNIMRRLFE